MGLGFIGIPGSGTDYNVNNFQAWYLAEFGVDVGSVDIVTAIVHDSSNGNVYCTIHNTVGSKVVRFPDIVFPGFGTDPDPDGDGVSTAMEDSVVPDEGAMGDGNNDGTLDSAQAHVASSSVEVFDVDSGTTSSAFFTIEVMEEYPLSGITMVNHATMPEGFDLLVDKVSFEITEVPGGGSATVNIYTHGVVVDSFMKVNPDDENDMFPFTFTHLGNIFTVTLTDGSDSLNHGDFDGAENGEIQDPFFVGKKAVPTDVSLWSLY